MTTNNITLPCAVIEQLVGALELAVLALTADTSGKLMHVDKRIPALVAMEAALTAGREALTGVQGEMVAGPTLRKRANRLLEQLSENRPRRVLDIDATRNLLEAIAAPSDTEKRIEALIRAAWNWGASCEIDDVPWGKAGDSHNEFLRGRTTEAANNLQAALLTATHPQSSEPAPSTGTTCKYGQERKKCTSSPMDCQCAIDVALSDCAAPSTAVEPVTDAMVDAYLTEQRRTVEEADRFGRPNIVGLHTNTVREACRNGIRAALLSVPTLPVGGADGRRYTTFANNVGTYKSVARSRPSCVAHLRKDQHVCAWYGESSRPHSACAGAFGRRNSIRSACKCRSVH